MKAHRLTIYKARRWPFRSWRVSCSTCGLLEVWLRSHDVAVQFATAHLTGHSKADVTSEAIGERLGLSRDPEFVYPPNGGTNA